MLWLAAIDFTSNKGTNMTDDDIVELSDIMEAEIEVSQYGTPAALEMLAETEPALAGFIQGNLKHISGELVLAGASGRCARRASVEAVKLALTVLGAMRRAHYRLWHDDVAPDSPLAKLDGGLAQLDPPQVDEGMDGKSS